MADQTTIKHPVRPAPRPQSAAPAVRGFLPLAICLLLTGCGNDDDFQGRIGQNCQTSRDCRFELHCQEQTGTCQIDIEEEPDGLGTDCADNNGCGGGLLCQPETNTCQVIEDGPGIPGPALLGQACALDDECDTGLVCQFASETCQAPGGEDLDGVGASCITNGDCPGDLVCQDESNTCQVAPLPDGV